MRLQPFRNYEPIALRVQKTTVLQEPELDSYFVFTKDELRAFRNKREALLHYLSVEPDPPKEFTEHDAKEEVNANLECESRKMDHNWALKSKHDDGFEEMKIKLLEAKRRIYMRDAPAMVVRRNRERLEDYQKSVTQRMLMHEILQSIEIEGSDKGTQSLARILGESEIVDGYWAAFLPLVAPFMIRKLEGDIESIGEFAYWENRQSEETITEDDQDVYVENREAQIALWADTETADIEAKAKLLSCLRDLAVSC